MDFVQSTKTEMYLIFSVFIISRSKIVEKPKKQENKTEKCCSTNDYVPLESVFKYEFLLITLFAVTSVSLCGGQYSYLPCAATCSVLLLEAEPNESGG